MITDKKKSDYIIKLILLFESYHRTAMIKKQKQKLGNQRVGHKHYILLEKNRININTPNTLLSEYIHNHTQTGRETLTGNTKTTRRKSAKIFK